MGTRIEQTDLARDALYTKVNQIANEQVSLDDAQTITGDKTFSGNVIKSMDVSNNGFKVQTTLNRGTPPTSQQGNAWGQFTFQSAGGLSAAYRIGGVEVEYAIDGSIIAQLEAFEPVSTGLNYEKIAITYPASGSAYTYAPTPSLSSSASGYANQIVTVGYLDTGLSSTVKLTGNQTIAGTKTFSSTISGSINGNATTVTNGVYTTGNQTIAGTKTFSSTISGSINGNAATVTNGVYTTGNQTIAGEKTFTDVPIFYRGNPYIIFSSPNVTKGTNPANNTNMVLTFTGDDKSASSNYSLARLWFGLNSDGTTFAQLRAYKNIAGTNTAEALSIYYPTSGDPYTSAPTPAVSSNTTNIATTAYVNNKFKKVSTLPASPDANTFYFIPE